MGRLTTDKKTNDMSMVEMAHNCCYARDRVARYRDYDTDIDVREFARSLMVAYGHWKVDGLDTDNEIINDDIFDESIMENLIHEPDNTIGLIALFYRNLWAMADLREKLKAYEDIIDDPEKLKLIDGWYSDLCKENGQLKKELAEYKKLEEEGLLIKLPCKVGDKAYHVIEDMCAEPQIYISEHVITDVSAKEVYFADDWWKVEEMDENNAFLTKEEAEQALKQMKEVQDVN